MTTNTIERNSELGPARSAAPSLEDLQEKYRTCSEREAPGVLHAIAEFLNSAEGVTRFLVKVATEHKPWEPNHRFRREARTILLRQVANKLLRGDRRTERELKEADLCVDFFGAHEDHCSFGLTGRDEKDLIEFLHRRCQKPGLFKPDLDLPEPAIKALINAKDFAYLIENKWSAGKAVPILHRHMWYRYYTILQAQAARSDAGWAEGEARDRAFQYCVPNTKGGIAPRDKIVVFCADILSDDKFSSLRPHARALFELRVIVPSMDDPDRNLGMK